jgi:Flp pilus assembly protein TadG
VIRPPQWPRRRDERGITAIQLALALPVLLLLLFGLVDVGRMLNAQLTVSSAARAGARAHVFGQSAQEKVVLASKDLPNGPATTSVDDACGTIGRAKVTATYDFTFVTPLGALARLVRIDSSVTLDGVGVMTCAR